MWKFKGSIKKRWNLQGCWRKTHVDFPWILLSNLGISKECQTILQYFQGWKLVFSWNSRSKVTNLKFTDSSNPPSAPPVYFFSGIAHGMWVELNIAKDAYVEFMALLSRHLSCICIAKVVNPGNTCFMIQGKGLF